MKLKKATKIARRGGALAQVAALPYRRSGPDAVHFLLLTSRETKRFVIPKGWRMKGKSEAQAAALEAGQEAGVDGRIDPVPLGTYRYWKRLRRAFVPVSVTVYGLEVEDERDDWKERDERSREWLTREQAISLVDEPELVTLIAGFAPPG
jgi:8-oxo-dGTP pyrophosphatase MutT (NUDIX family)